MDCKAGVGDVAGTHVGVAVQTAIAIVKFLPLRSKHPGRDGSKLDFSVQLCSSFRQLNVLPALPSANVPDALILHTKWSTVRVRERSYVGMHALNKRRNWTQLDVIPAFKDAYNPSLSKLIGDLLQVLCEPLIIKL